MGTVIALALVVACWIGFKHHLKNKRLKQRRDQLMAKYADASLVERIMQGRVWQGQTSGQLRDSIGPPADVDERVLESKVHETWKYRRQGAGYGLRIALEEGVVVGWDDKA